MSPGAHALASIAIVRGVFPRQRVPFLLAVVLAGTLADIDLLTLLSGPEAYLSGRMTCTHSILGSIVVMVLAILFGRWLEQKLPPRKAGDMVTRGSVLLLGVTTAAVVHLLMDLATSSGVALLWPFRQTRFAWDLLPSTDPWILLLFIAGIFLPELFALVSSEIGAKDKAPRGRNGALIALAFICIYAGARYSFHANATAQLDAHSYRGESPRRVAALPDAFSVLNWHAIVETTSQICTTDVPATNSTRFDPEAAICVHKPEPSPALATALQTQAAQRFVTTARFPRASVNTLDSETEIVVRDVRDFAVQGNRFALAARVLLDSKGQVSSQRILWARQRSIAMRSTW